MGDRVIEVETKRPVEILDITNLVKNAVAESKVDSGIALVYALHITTALVMNEAEPGLLQDLVDAMAKVVVPKGAGYRHDRSDGNAHAHLQTALLGNSAVLPVDGWRPRPGGTWQRVLFVELDGPRHRCIYVKVM
jgi:secondary thiamine-phosphate synthase enzyme